MSNHQASYQILGYLYQVRYALALLMQNDNQELQISIEKFDDVAFSKDGEPLQLIQLKHHINQKGNLTDSSTDLWRTLNVWIDLISHSPEILEKTYFFIITTAVAPSQTAAFYLKTKERDPSSAYDILKEICVKSENKAHKKYYDSFLNVDESIIKKLINRIYVIDSAEDIIGVEKVLKKSIRFSCLPKYEDQLLERLEGWWYRKLIEALCSDTPIFITQNQVRSFIVSISHEYLDDNLPIDSFENLDKQNQGLDLNKEIFYEQLKLINVNNRRAQIALRNYYRAYEQRSSWLRNDLLFMSELEHYDQRLIDEWENAFANMSDKLDRYNAVTEQEKINEGSALLSDIENKDLRIRPKCQYSFIMRGSYHMLANQLKVGWHIDFKERLKYLLNNLHGDKKGEKLE